MGYVPPILLRKNKDLGELELFARICANGLEQASKAEESVELKILVANILGDPSPFESAATLEKAKADAARVAAFAAAQTSEGSPYLFGLCVVRLWTVLEALVDELIIEAMHEPSRHADQDLLGRLKGPLIQFQKASPEDQAEYLAETLKQAVEAPLKLGVGRFEAVLAPIGLGGSVEEPVRKALLELSQIRNVIVHKSGKADQRLIKICPWICSERGASVAVNGKSFRKYLMASWWYLVELTGRRADRMGEERSPHQAQGQAVILSWVVHLG